MREAGNIREVEQVGVDMIGFIFYPKSSRYVEEVPEYLPQHAKRVGVFVNESIESILNIVTCFGLNYVQLHGEESAEFCGSLSQS
ncbi:N-(5'-phosphoribosyl)anthranilate isomerase, partial [termite gut metagenome]